MSSLVTPTTPSVITSPIPAVILATASLGTRSTLDLRTKWGAWVFARIGRRAATALTVAARIVIRRTHNNDAVLNPSQSLDRISSIVAAAATTVNGATSIGATTLVLTTATGFAAGDIVCVSDGTPTTQEFARVSSVSGSTLTFDAPLKTAHANGDTITNGADVFPPMFLAGGSVYEFRADNGASGQSLLFECLAQTYDSDTIT